MALPIRLVPSWGFTYSPRFRYACVLSARLLCFALRMCELIGPLVRHSGMFRSTGDGLPSHTKILPQDSFHTKQERVKIRAGDKARRTHAHPWFLLFVGERTDCAFVGVCRIHSAKTSLNEYMPLDATNQTTPPLCRSWSRCPSLACILAATSATCTSWIRMYVFLWTPLFRGARCLCCVVLGGFYGEGWQPPHI